MNQKTSMFGSAMSNNSKPQNNVVETSIAPKKVGRPKGSLRKVPTKSSFTTKLDNDLLTTLKSLSEEKSQPINKIIEDFVQFALISIGRGDAYHCDIINKTERDKMCKYDLKVIEDRYKKLQFG